MDVYFSFALAVSAGLQLFNSYPLSIFSGRNQDNETWHQNIPDVQGPFGNVCCLPQFSCCCYLTLTSLSVTLPSSPLALSFGIFQMPIKFHLVKGLPYLLVDIFFLKCWWH